MDLVKSELEKFILSISHLESEYKTYFDIVVKYYQSILGKISIDSTDDVQSETRTILIRKKILTYNTIGQRNYFTINSKDSFTNLPTGQPTLDWGKGLIYHPLNDHSRRYLKRGDVLFCYRQGQFNDLDEALNTRGIYAIGIAATDPYEIFSNEEGHKKWGVLVAFPFTLCNHLELRNIQLHPKTINLTPYNGNRNDALQHIPEKNHYLTLLKLIYSRNVESKITLSTYFNDLELTEIPLPTDIYSKIYDSSKESTHDFIDDQNTDVVIDNFIKWFYEPQNYKKSYDGLVNKTVLKFWNTEYFSGKLFSLNVNDIPGSILKIQDLISTNKNPDWLLYNESTSKGAPKAVIGENNYLKFLHVYFDNELGRASLQNINRTKIISRSKFSIESFQVALKQAGLIYSNQLILRFVSSLITKPFVILTGLSGSGKTKIAQAFVQWICQDESEYRIIPVGADWTNREPLLGYPNALKLDEYVRPDSGVLDLIIQANRQPERSHFLILDEMNLSHVERYFADFLSVMESKEEIPLFSEGTLQNGVPARLKVPSNLFIIGTVNIDETTNMFSPKVLDRANTIEFRVTQDEMKNFLGNFTEINIDALSRKGSGMSKSFLEMAASREFATADITEINSALVQFFSELKKTGAEFGYRSATEILRLIHQLSVLDNTLTTYQKIDIGIMHKLLPKLHGSRRKLCPVLETLGSLCISTNVSIIKDVFERPDFDYNGKNVLYPLSLEKIARMYRGAIDNGFASFAEA